MNNCDLIRDLMPLYADGQASEPSRRCIEEHTAHCPACKKLLSEMCTPLEPEPEDRTEQIMEMLYKKQRRRTVLTIASVILAVVLTVWGFLEIRYSGDLLYAASTNEERILKEVPELALTEEELALAQTILDIPEIRDAMESGQDSVTLNTNALMPHLSSILPENGEIVEVFLFGKQIYISIIAGNRYTCLVYYDGDNTGHIDQIQKTLAISPLDEIGPDGHLGDVDEVYELFYAVGSGMTKCKKYKTRHMWFSFLDW